MPLSVNCTKLMYVGLTFSVPGVTFDLDSFGFEVLIGGSSAKHNAAPKKQSAKINPVVFIFMRPIESGSLFPVNISLFRGRTIWIADAYRRKEKRFVVRADENPNWIADARHGAGNRFIVHADEKLTAFLDSNLR